MIVTLPRSLKCDAFRDDNCLDSNNITTDYVTEKIHKLFLNEKEINDVSEIEEAFRNVVLYHHYLKTDNDTSSYSKILEILLDVLIPSSVFKVMNVDWSVFNFAILGKNFLFISPDSCNGHSSYMNGDHITRIGTYARVVNDTDRRKIYTGCFIINFKLNNVDKHCVLCLTTKDGVKDYQPEFKMMSDNDYINFVTKRAEFILKHGNYDSICCLRKYSESKFRY